MPKKTLKEIAAHVGGEVIGTDSVVIESAATLDSAGNGQITFLSNPKYAPNVKTTKAAAILVAKQVETNACQIVTEDPYYAFMQTVVLLHGHRRHPQTGISKQADFC